LLLVEGFFSAVVTPVYAYDDRLQLANQITLFCIAVSSDHVVYQVEDVVLLSVV
jgi:hypothetical protein